MRGQAWQHASRAALAMLALIATVFALMQAEAVMLPLVSAMVLGMTAGPLVDWARAHGIRPVFTAFVLTLALMVTLAAALVLMSDPVAQWAARLPELGSRISMRLGFLMRPLSAWREMEGALQGSSNAPAVEIATSPASFFAYMLSLAGPALGQFLVFITAFFFFIAGRQSLKQKVTLSSISREDRLRVLHISAEIEKSLAAWISTAALINLGLAFVMGTILWVLGVPNPAMWGLFIFILNFIPYVGPLLMAVVGFLSFETLGRALLPVFAYVCVAAVEGNVLTPQLMGWRLSLHPFLVFFAIVFGSWLWGPAGALLATPLLIIFRVVLAALYPPEEPDLPG